MKVIGYHIAKGMVFSTDKSCTSDNLLEGMLSKQEALRVLFNLDYSLADILKSLGVTEEEGNTMLLTTFLFKPPYKLRYIPGKFLSIKKNTSFAYYSNASQYKVFPLSYLSKDPSELILEAKKVGERVCSVFKDLGINTTSLTNPIRVYEKSHKFKTEPLEDQINSLAGAFCTQDEVGRKVIQKILAGLVVSESTKEDSEEIVTLDRAIKEHKWSELGKIRQAVRK